MTELLVKFIRALSAFLKGIFTPGGIKVIVTDPVPVPVPEPVPVPTPVPDPDPVPVPVPEPDPIETGNEPELPNDPDVPELPADTKIADVLRIARSYIGVKEDANGETEFGRIFNNPTGAWCAMFTSVVLAEAGLTKGTDFPWTAWTPSGVAWGQSKAAFFTSVAAAKPGDLVFFMWDGVSPAGRGEPPVAHVGFVEEGVNAQGYITTIEGNTSDSVARRFRQTGVVGFVRPLYGSEKPVLVLGDRVLMKGATGADVGEWQELLNELLPVFAPSIEGLTVDEDFGIATDSRTKMFQVKFGLEPDGAVGPLTLTKARAELVKLLNPPVVVPPPTPAPKIYTTAEQDAFFKAVGLRSGTAAKRRESTIRWQEASTWLGIGVDGVFGELTTKDADIAVKNGYRISPHFALSEFRCPCGGSNAGCKVSQVHGALVRKLEKVRADGYPNGISIVSGYRDPTYNTKIGGTSNSAHMDGLAADFDANRGPEFFKGRGFHGIEVRKWSGEVSHVDLQVGLREDYVFYV